MKQISLANPKYLLIVLILLMASIYLYQNQALPLSTKPTSSTDKETTNWQTYSNQRYNFTFSYPTNWGVGSKERCGDWYAQTELPRLGPEYVSSTGGCPSEGSTLSFWSDSKYLKELLSYKDFEIKSSKTVVGGKEARYLQIEDVGSDDKRRDPKERIIVIIPLSNNELVAELGNIQQKEAFDKILSSIKFQSP